MTFAFKNLVVAASLVAAGLSSAGAVTIPASGSVVAGDWTLSNTTGNAVLVFSDTEETGLIGALNAASAKLAGISPALFNSTNFANGKYITAQAAAPLTSLSGNLTGANTFAITGVQSAGGALVTTEKDGFATRGGSLSITNLRADFETKRVFASITGANGVGTVDNLFLWNYANSVGATSGPLVNGVNSYKLDLNGLTITPEAFNLFSTALGLTAVGTTAFGAVTDFGKISGSFAFTAAQTPAIPEPSTYALMGLGLVGIGLVARRRAK